MRMRFIVMLFLGAGLLVACSTGTHAANKGISAVKLAAIRNGMTTKDQVRTLLGDPQSSKMQVPVRQPQGVPPLPAKYIASEIWAFWSRSDKGPSFHLPFAPRSVEKPPCTVIIYFDERGTVLDCETSGELRN
ncbi:MAG TPA: hypothetical protein VF795_01380 [Desulfuromonadaceae bacterium]